MYKRRGARPDPWKSKRKEKERKDYGNLKEDKSKPFQ